MKFYDGSRSDMEVFGTSDKWTKAWEVAWEIASLIKQECTSIAQAEIVLDRALEYIRQAPVSFAVSAKADQAPSQST